jgi:hypothetical protein
MKKKETEGQQQQKKGKNTSRNRAQMDRGSYECEEFINAAPCWNTISLDL